MTPLYTRFTGAHREQFHTLAEAREGFSLHWPDDFNFAYDVLDALASETPDALCLLHIDNEERETRVTFAEMKRLSDKAANMFASAGIKRGDVTLLVLGRKLSFWACLLGLHKLGATCVQATHMLTAKDYSYRCEAAGIQAAVLMGEGDCAHQFSLGAGDRTPIRFITGGTGTPGFLDFDALFAEASECWTRRETKASERMLILFSSGTSGYPKMVTHDFTYPLGHIVTAVYWQRVQEGGLHFTISDTGWGKALWGKIYGQWLGGSAVLVYDFDRFSAERVLSVMQKTRVTTFCVPPTMYRMLLQCDLTKYDLSSLVHCATAGEALSPEIFETWREATGLSIYEGFGQTETPLMLATLAPYEKPLPGAIGLPVPGFDVFVLDDSGNVCEQGVTGEICVRATAANRPRGLTTGYYRNDEATANAWRGGYYHTGDTAYRDERGLYHYVGRNDDIIKSSGYRIGPFEVESVLLTHPAVLECAVTGVPDAIRGFAVKATIKLMDGYAPSEALVKDIQNFVKHNTAPYKYPRVVQFVDALPKTFNGKILRNEIRKADMDALTQP